MAKRYELTDQQWDLIRDLFENPARGRPAKEPRHLWNAIFWVMWSGSPWRDLPERYGYWNNVYQRFSHYQRSGKFDEVLKRLHLRLAEDNRLDFSLFCVDGSNVRAQVSAAGASKKSRRKPNQKTMPSGDREEDGAAKSTF